MPQDLHACDPAPSVTAAERAAVDAALAAWPTTPLSLVQVLRAVQDRTGWLSPAVRARIGVALGCSATEVTAVAGFYRFFRLEPTGRVELLFSDNVTDRHLGSRTLAADLCRRLGVTPGRTRADGAVRVDVTSCTGLGDQGPALLVDQRQVVTRLDERRVAEIARRIDAGDDPADWPADWQRVDDQVRRADLLLRGDLPRGEALRAMLARDAQAAPAARRPPTLDEIDRSRLRGRGGAGFGCATKWTFSREAPLPPPSADLPAPTRVVVCNADEGEPGTFKDRVLLAREADAVFEGMTVAARQVGAREGYVYLRGEYRFLLPHLESVLAARRRDGLLGPRILGVDGFDFDIAIHLGAGAYVCGEESALLESLEGRRGVPRVRPPFPAERGYRGQPTLVNNVETLVAAAHIAWKGADAWTAHGTAVTTGTKLHSVSGDCERPGVYEFPAGIAVAELLEAAGARDAMAVQIGGPSGSLLAAAEFGRRLAFEDVPTTGACMVFDTRRDPFEIVRGFQQFFAHESCGFCTPCRVGTALIVRRLDKLAAGQGSTWDAASLRDLDDLLHGTTHCGLGATAANPLRDALRRFPQAFERRAAGTAFRPAFSLDDALAGARAATGRDDPAAHGHPAHAQPATGDADA